MEDISRGGVPSKKGLGRELMEGTNLFVKPTFNEKIKRILHALHIIRAVCVTSKPKYLLL